MIGSIISSVGGFAVDKVGDWIGGGDDSVGCYPQIDINEARAMYADPAYYSRIEQYARSKYSGNALSKALQVDKAVFWANSPTDDCKDNDQNWNNYLSGLLAERRRGGGNTSVLLPQQPTSYAPTSQDKDVGDYVKEILANLGRAGLETATATVSGGLQGGVAASRGALEGSRAGATLFNSTTTLLLLAVIAFLAFKAFSK